MSPEWPPPTRLLAEYQRANPRVTVEALVRSHDVGWGPRETDARYATGALFVDAVYRGAASPGSAPCGAARPMRLPR